MTRLPDAEPRVPPGGYDPHSREHGYAPVEPERGFNERGPSEWRELAEAMRAARGRRGDGAGVSGPYRVAKTPVLPRRYEYRVWGPSGGVAGESLLGRFTDKASAELWCSGLNDGYAAALDDTRRAFSDNVSEGKVVRE